MNLKEFLSETEALTYLNALRVTLIQIKDELATQEELTEYLNSSRDRTRKLVRKMDGQYRLLSKLQNSNTPLVTEVTVQENLEQYDDEMKELMEEV